MSPTLGGWTETASGRAAGVSWWRNSAISTCFTYGVTSARLGEVSRKEGGKIFGSGSRAPIAISVFVKNPNATEHGRIHFHDIGDYLDQKQKLSIIQRLPIYRRYHNGQGLAVTIVPDEHNDWLDQD
jgi:predicted helicase